MKPRIFLVGPPSSGKGYCVSSLVKDHALEHIRETWLLKTANARGMKCVEGKEGALDDATTAAILTELVAASRGCIMDGIPKNGAQAEAMKGVAADKLVVIDVPQAELEEFHANRLVDPETMQTYDKVKNPPPEDVVARCTTQAMDAEDKVKERLDPYYAELEAIKTTFGDKVLLIKGTTTTGGEAEAALYKELCTQLGL